MKKTLASLFTIALVIAIAATPFFSIVAGWSVSEFFGKYAGTIDENTGAGIRFNIENGTPFYGPQNLTLTVWAQGGIVDNDVFKPAVYSVSYQASWEGKRIQIYSYSINDVSDLTDDEPNYKSMFFYNFTKIPQGPQHIEANAIVGGYKFFSALHGASIVNEFKSFNESISASLDFAFLVPPKIFNTSIKNETYDSTSIPLIFNVDKRCPWLGYSLDNFANVTIAGNTTLTGLSAGNHSLVVFANDSFGAMAKSEVMNFSVKVPETFEGKSLMFIAPVVILVIVSLGLVVYFRRRKKDSK